MKKEIKLYAKINNTNQLVYFVFEQAVYDALVNKVMEQSGLNKDLAELELIMLTREEIESNNNYLPPKEFERVKL